MCRESTAKVVFPQACFPRKRLKSDSQDVPVKAKTMVAKARQKAVQNKSKEYPVDQVFSSKAHF
jgi:hypothetical protein